MYRQVRVGLLGKDTATDCPIIGETIFYSPMPQTALGKARVANDCSDASATVSRQQQPL
jgi:hypothetical protein